MTGYHSGHFQQNNLPGTSLPADTRALTTPRMLQKAGYVTAGVGKMAPLDQPTAQGFDYFIGQVDQALCHNMYPDQIDTGNETLNVDLPLNHAINRSAGSAAARAQCMASPASFNYTVDITHRHSMQWLREQGKLQRDATVNGVTPTPFFLYEAFTVPHAGGWATPPAHAAEHGAPVPTDGVYANETGWPDVERDHASVITYLDGYVGELVATLDGEGLTQNTIVFFGSDNGAHLEGGHDYHFFNSTGGLLGHKRSLFEGGVRSPTMVSWPGTIKPAVSGYSWAFWDIMPTLAELAGATAPSGIDGVSIVPTLMGSTTQAPKKYLYWTWPGDKASPLSPAEASSGEWRLEQSPDGTALYVRTDVASGAERETRAARGAGAGKKNSGYGVRMTGADGTLWKGVVEQCGSTGIPTANDNMEVYNLSSDPFETNNIATTAAGRAQRSAFLALLVEESVLCACFQC
jgi:arylsulfatase A-like enzyme